MVDLEVRNLYSSFCDSERQSSGSEKGKGCQSLTLLDPGFEFNIITKQGPRSVMDTTCDRRGNPGALKALTERKKSSMRILCSPLLAVEIQCDVGLVRLRLQILGGHFWSLFIFILPSCLDFWMGFVFLSFLFFLLSFSRMMDMRLRIRYDSLYTKWDFGIHLLLS